MDMKKIIALIMAAVFTIGCGMVDKEASSQELEKGEVQVVTIAPAEAKKIMDSGEDYILLDVRNKVEYDFDGHISGALLIPLGVLESEVEGKIPDKSQQILVYCRSGRRSKEAARVLSGMGYINVKDIGGIIDWPYEIEN